MSLKLLIVDDEGPLIWAMERFFAAAGHQVDCTQELRTALQLVGMRSYDVAITDLRLSGTLFEEGLVLTDFIRLHVPQTRTVLLTAYHSTELEERARRRGADLILSKPQPLPELARYISDLTRGRPGAATGLKVAD